MRTQSITSITDGERKQYKRLVEDAADNALADAGLDKEGLQRLIDKGDEFQARIVAGIHELSVSNQFTDEEVESSRGYLSGYEKPSSLASQVAVVRELFHGLGETDIALGGKKLPDGAEGYFALPRWQEVAPTYGKAVEMVLDALSKAYDGRFKNQRRHQLGPNRLRQSSESTAMWERIGQQQKRQIFVVAGQFGLRHRGRSIRRAREVMRAAEFGLGAFEVGIMLITHRKRLAHYDDLWIYCVGDEFDDPQASAEPFALAPSFRFGEDGLEFGTYWYDYAVDYYGSASGWAICRGRDA